MVETVLDLERKLHGPFGAVHGAHETVADGLDFVAFMLCDELSDNGVMMVQCLRTGKRCLKGHMIGRGTCWTDEVWF